MANNYISFKKITLLSGQTIQQWIDTYYNSNLHQYTRFTFYNSDGNIVGEYIGNKIVINGVNEAELLTKEDKINKVTTISSTPTDINYPSEKAVKTALDNLLTTVNTSLDNKVNKNASITGGTFTKITFDSKGLVTGGANLTKADIPNIDATQVIQDATHRFVTDTEKSTWSAKQNALGFTPENVSNKKTTITNSDTDYPTAKAVLTALSAKQDSLGFTPENVANKKTVINNSDAEYPTSKAVLTALNTKQETLVSGTNIKTILNNSLLGTGNIDINFSDLSGDLTINTSTGTGNAITSLTASGSVITPVKGSTFLLASAKGETANKSLTFGSTFKVVQTVAGGSVNERTMTLPEETQLSRVESGTGNVVGNVTVSGHTVTVVKTEVADKPWVIANTRSNTWVPDFDDLPTGTGSNQVSVGNHTHGNISSTGAIGTASGKLIETSTNGVLVAKTSGTNAQYLRGDNVWATLNLDSVPDGTTRKLSNYELLSNKQTTGTLSNSVSEYASTSVVKTYVDSSVSTVQIDVNNLEDAVDDIELSLAYKVDEAPDDGKVFARQSKDWLALESAAALRNALAWRDTEEGEIYVPAEIVDGGLI